VLRSLNKKVHEATQNFFFEFATSNQTFSKVGFGYIIKNISPPKEGGKF